MRQFRTTFPEGIFKFKDNVSRQKAKKAWQAAGIYLEGNDAFRQGNYQKAIQDYIRAYKEDPTFSPSRGQLFQYALENANNYSFIYPKLTPTDQERLRLIRKEAQYNNMLRSNQ
jgi:hypothetical protein